MKKFISSLLSALLIASVICSAPFAVSAAEAEGEIPVAASSDNNDEAVGAKSGTTGDCTWTLDDNGTLTINGKGAMGDYSREYKNINGNYIPFSTAPWGANIKSAVIENGVTSIGVNAFCGCTGLTSVTIPNSVTSIGYDAFYKCTGLTKVNITDITAWCSISFASGSSNPLYYAHNLYLNNELVTELIIPDSVTSIGLGAFYGCESLTSVIIPDSVTSIGNSAFHDCKSLTSVTVPDSVTSIGNSAFYGCTGLTSVIIPDSVTSIGNDTFKDCTGLTIYCSMDSYAKTYAVDKGFRYALINGSGITGDCLWILDNGTLTIIGEGKMGDYSSFQSPWGVGIKSLVVENGVKNIGEYAFYGCKNLTSVTIPDSVTSIGDWAFYGCSGLTNLTIPNSVTYIGLSGFSGCTGLKSITIPDSVTGISNAAFYGCTGLKSIIIPDSVTSIGIYAFSGCTGLTSVTIPDSVTSIGYEAFYGCTSLTEVVIPDSVTSIGASAFSGCTALTKVVIPDSVKSIESTAFSNCSKITLVFRAENTYAKNFAQKNNIPYKLITSGTTGDCKWKHFDGNLNISGNGAMSDTPTAAPWGTEVKSVVIENGVTNIRSNAFFSCTKLTDVTIPETVTSIGKWAFYGCKALESVTVPASVTSIGDQAFKGCADDFTVYGYSDTFAEEYAEKNGFIFKEIGSESSNATGDVNGDNAVDVLDASLIQKFTVEKVTLTDEQKEAADVNNDSVCDILDASDIQKFTVEKLTEFKKKS